jgi:hypothetical protein
VDQPSEALHKASSGRDAEQDGVVHLFARRELGEALGDALCRDHYGDRSLVGVAVVFIWHARDARGRLLNR